MNFYFKATILLFNFLSIVPMYEPKFPIITELQEKFPNSSLRYAKSYAVITLFNANIIIAQGIYLQDEHSKSKINPHVDNIRYRTILTLYNEDTRTAVEKLTFFDNLPTDKIIEYIKKLDEQYGKKQVMGVKDMEEPSVRSMPVDKENRRSQAPIIEDLPPKENQPSNKELLPKKNDGIGFFGGEYSLLGMPLRNWFYSLGAAVVAGTCFVLYRLYKKKNDKKHQSVVIISNGSLPA